MFVIRIENNQASKLETDGAFSLVNTDPLTWVHLEGDVVDAKTWLTSHANPDEETVNLLCDELTRPRVIVNGSDDVITTIRVPYIDDEQSVKFASLRVWITAHYLVTISYLALPIVHQIKDQLLRKAYSLSSPYLLCATIFEKANDQITHHTVTLDEGLSEIEDRWDAQHTPDLDALYSLRLYISQLNRYLLSQMEAFLRLGSIIPDRVKTAKEKKHHASNWREMANTLKRDMEAITEMRERIVILLDAIQQNTNEKMNDIMYRLSIIAAFFLPLTFFASLLGMNVEGIPFQKHTLAFWLVCIGMMIVLLFQWLLFKRWRLFK